MKNILLIIVVVLIPTFAFSQKGHGANHGKHNNAGRVNKIIVHNHYSTSIKRKGPPSWAPANGYRHRYIYFPEHKCYYDNYNGFYIYRKGTVWVTSYYLPAFIINIGSARKIELNIDDVPNPQIYFEQHITLY